MSPKTRTIAPRLREIPDLSRRLSELLTQVPAGRVTTCRALARALGDPIAARWVGQFLIDHQHSSRCVCHRVVRADGQVGQYIAGPASQKMQRLADEGVKLRQGVVDLARYGFEQFTGQRPLERLSRLQEAILKAVLLRGLTRVPKLVAGLDVSYPAPDRGVAAYGVVEVQSGRLVWSRTICRPLRFPYITTYLAFRELPLLVELLQEVRAAGRLASAVLVDGSGVLHPRGAGIATHLGVLAGVRTIGVTKRLLCGQVDLKGLRPLESRPVVHLGQVLGVAIRPATQSRRPIIVSPGHRIGVRTAEAVVRRMLKAHRLPEPLFWADRLSRRGFFESRP
ncbi:MAG: endonuclease V [Thermoguttaceae bacterium]